MADIWLLIKKYLLNERRKDDETEKVPTELSKTEIISALISNISGRVLGN